jgi:vancomycin resistance protein YoaR
MKYYLLINTLMNKKTKKKLLMGLDVFLIFLVFLLFSCLIFEKIFENRIYPNIYINNIEMSSFNKEAATFLLKQEVENFQKKGFKISLNEREIYWHNNSLSVDIETEKAVNEAYNIARSGSYTDIFKKINLLFSQEKINLDFSIKEDLLFLILKDNFSDLETLAQDAQLKIETNLDEEVEKSFYIEAEKAGTEINREKFLEDFEKNIENLKNNDIELQLVDKEPLITRDNSRGLEFEADSLLEMSPFNLTYKDEEAVFEVDSLEFASWLELSPEIQEEKFVGATISLDLNEIERFLENVVEPELNRDPSRPVFEFKDDRVTLFDPGEDGLVLNREESLINIQKAFQERSMNNIPLVMELDSIEKISDINDLGIEEIIGTGHSNYAGSPANRRHNIKTGAEKLSGMIIKPGEEFSTVQAIGQVSRGTGYLPELVIKDNRTIPEYGGGLCQISTTLFRAALDAGLEITERRPHSYRVLYYEPAGMDASVYNPWPDFKFINDTSSNILIQARFEGYNDLYFDFWGESDGREVTVTDPVVYNIVNPGPTKIIETTELEPGERDCIESAIAGADAHFDQIIKYPDEEEAVENRFYSKYVPWRKVCLLGVEPEAEEEEEIEEQEQEESHDD